MKVKKDMEKRIMVIDSSLSGVSGDMLLGALVDLGASEKDLDKVSFEVCKAYPNCNSIKIRIKDVTRSGFSCKYIETEIDEEHIEIKASKIKEYFKEILKRLKANDKTKTIAIKALEGLIEAEIKAHGANENEIHFHELASVDTAIDIIGVAYLANSIDIFDGLEVITTPLSVGGGSVKFSHGTIANPTPAIVNIALKNELILKGGPVDHELTTPTGITLVASLAKKSSSYYPKIIPTKIGLGAGKNDFKEIPNMVRIIIGKTISPYKKEEIILLETNVDDVSGEIIGHALNMIIENGALDINIIPAYTKKNRPSNIIQILTTPELESEMVDILVNEIGTLGIRTQTINRHVINRSEKKLSIRIEGKIEKVNLKISRNRENKIIKIKPEYEDLKRISQKFKMSLREIEKIVNQEILKIKNKP